MPSVRFLMLIWKQTLILKNGADIQNRKKANFFGGLWTKRE
jgi:hypothetical protein